MIVVGLLLGLVGTDLYTGATRYTFGQTELADGLNFIAVSVGVFGIAVILKNLEIESTRTTVVKRVTGLLPSRAAFRRMAAPILRVPALCSVQEPLHGAATTDSIG